MPRAAIVLLSPFAVLACASHEPASYGTTTVRSASTEGPRVTDVRDRDDADELADAICRHERTCTERGATVTAGAAPRAGAACVAEVKPSATLSLSSLDCAPAVARAGLKDCLAALSSNDCSAPVSSDSLMIPACRPEMLCRER